MCLDAGFPQSSPYCSAAQQPESHVSFAPGGLHALHTLLCLGLFPNLGELGCARDKTAEFAQRGLVILRHLGAGEEACSTNKNEEAPQLWLTWKNLIIMNIGPLLTVTNSRHFEFLNGAVDLEVDHF